LHAYEAYLKALHHKNRLARESLERIKEYLEQAIALDPHFALAYAEMAAYFFSVAMAGIRPAHEAMPQVRDWALKALTLDDRLPDAHRLLGDVAMNYDYDWGEAERRYQLALAREPVPVLVRASYARYLHYTGRTGEALDQMAVALRQDPLQPILRLTLAGFLTAAGRLDDASAEMRAVLELDERVALAHLGEGMQCAIRGRLADALVSAERAYALEPRATRAVGLLAGVLTRLGEKTRAEELLRTLRSMPTYSAAGYVVFYLVCGEIDRAIDWVIKVVEERDPSANMFILNNRRIWRTSSRWPVLARMLNLPETQTASAS